MKPYYDKAGITIYHGDCREILRFLPDASVDAVITDPPYERMKGGIVIDHPGVATINKTSRTLSNELGSAEGLEHSGRIAKLGAISFCSYHWIEDCLSILGGERKCLISWFKRNSPYSVNNAPWFLTEYAWAVQYAPGIDWRRLRTHYDLPMLQAGCMAGERITKDGKAVHPAQKPLALLSEFMLPGISSVLDPFMGTGTTLRAAKDAGVSAIGIESEERYCEIAAKRLEQGVLPCFVGGGRNT